MSSKVEVRNFSFANINRCFFLSWQSHSNYDEQGIDSLFSMWDTKTRTFHSAFSMSCADKMEGAWLAKATCYCWEIRTWDPVSWRASFIRSGIKLGFNLLFKRCRFTGEFLAQQVGVWFIDDRGSEQINSSLCLCWHGSVPYRYSKLKAHGLKRPHPRIARDWYLVLPPFFKGISIGPSVDPSKLSQ